MWGKQLVEGSKFVMDEPNLIPLLKDMDPREKIIISTIGNGVIQKTNKNPLKRKSMQSLAKLNLGKLNVWKCAHMLFILAKLKYYVSCYWKNQDQIKV